MLAASPTIQNSSLDLFRLALFLVETGDQNIPASLKLYFSEVLKQAKLIAHDPGLVSGASKPEAIELAVELREIDELLRELEAVDSIDAISPQLAKKFLKNMEVSSVHQDGFSVAAGFAN